MWFDTITFYWSVGNKSWSTYEIFEHIKEHLPCASYIFNYILLWIHGLSIWIYAKEKNQWHMAPYIAVALLGFSPDKRWEKEKGCDEAKRKVPWYVLASHITSRKVPAFMLAFSPSRFPTQALVENIQTILTSFSFIWSANAMHDTCFYDIINSWVSAIGTEITDHLN